MAARARGHICTSSKTMHDSCGVSFTPYSICKFCKRVSMSPRYSSNHPFTTDEALLKSIKRCDLYSFFAKVSTIKLLPILLAPSTSKALSLLFCFQSSSWLYILRLKIFISQFFERFYTTNLQLFKRFSKRFLQLFKRFLWWISQLFKGFLVKSGDFYCGWWGLAVVGRIVGFLVAELAGGGFVAAGAGAFARLLVSPHMPCRQPHCQQHQYQYNPTLYVHCFKIH